MPAQATWSQTVTRDRLAPWETGRVSRRHDTQQRTARSRPRAPRPRADLQRRTRLEARVRHGSPRALARAQTTPRVASRDGRAQVAFLRELRCRTRVCESRQRCICLRAARTRPTRPRRRATRRFDRCCVNHRAGAELQRLRTTDGRRSSAHHHELLRDGRRLDFAGRRA